MMLFITTPAIGMSATPLNGMVPENTVTASTGSSPAPIASAAIGAWRRLTPTRPTLVSTAIVNIATTTNSVAHRCEIANTMSSATTTNWTMERSPAIAIEGASPVPARHSRSTGIASSSTQHATSEMPQVMTTGRL